MELAAVEHLLERALGRAGARAAGAAGAALGPAGGEQELARRRRRALAKGSSWPSGRDPVELVLARALGAEWLDGYLAEWRTVTLEIDGADLIAAGVPEGPALGRGLRAALRPKLDGEVTGREQELATALAAASAARAASVC